MIDAHLNLYRERRPTYEALSQEIKRIIDVSFKQIKIKCHSVDARSKEIESFETKARKIKEDGNPRYSEPLKQITDLAGVRVIVYTIDDIRIVNEFIDKSFDVVEKRDVGEERIEQGQFGYQSVHYLTKLPDARLILPDYSHYKEMICEVQVRTVLQHAWAEMEHNIQYKGSDNIPKSIKRKFLSLAGLLEIADREFSAIQREDKLLKEGVLTQLQTDLTRDAMTRPDAVDAGLNASSLAQDQQQPSAQVRSLLGAGKYQDAIDVYDKKIEREPTNYTLYLGRARANFLLGETKLALEDIDKAEKYKPTDPAINALRSKIADGSLSSPQESQINEANEMMRLGNEAMVAGKPEEAFVLYSDAQNKGASWPFTTFNMALASALAGDTAGAQLLLDQLRIHPGTPMEINITALEAILLALDDHQVGFNDKLEGLKGIVSRKGDFILELSPLGRLRKLDLEKTWGEAATEIGYVLKVLSVDTPQQ